MPWTPQRGERLPSAQIYSLLAAQDGSLWIGTKDGIAHLIGQRLITFPTFHDSVYALLEDPSGRIWLSRWGDVPRGPVCEVFGDVIRCPGESSGISLSKCCAGPFTRDRSGDFWIGVDTTLIQWRPGRPARYFASGEPSDGLDGLNALVSSSDGSLWIGGNWTGRGGGLEHFIDGVRKPLILSGFNSTKVRVITILRDRGGALWIGTENQGIYHIYGGRVDRFGTNDGLSANLVLKIFEDREGTVWVATSKGIDCFHQLPVTTISSHEGLSGDNVVSVVSGPDNKIWVADADSLDSIENGRISSIRSDKGLPGHEVTSLFENQIGQLWVGVDNDLYLYKGNHFYRVTRHDGSSTRFIVGITEDTRHNIWAEVSGSNRELIRIRNLKVVDEYPIGLLPSARPLAADPQDGLWLGLRSGELARFRSGHLQVFHFPHNINSDVRQVVVNPDGSVFGTTAFGLIGVKREKSQVLKLCKRP
jgi:ligand-binding sensor domain-containing protein